jgi:large subunit ribosomal protein L14
MTKNFLLFNSTSSLLNHVQKTTRMKIVDDSQLAKDGMAYKRAPRIIHVYNKKGIGLLGDKILLAVNGQKQKAIIVGCKNYDRLESMTCFDTNNCVLVDDADTPLGTRILAPIPATLRRHPNCAKITAIATRFL